MRWPVRLAIKATTAAPGGYFPPVCLENAAGGKGLFVDGGMTANNPSEKAYIEALRLLRARDQE